jgi:hypothetical protein
MLGEGGHRDCSLARELYYILECLVMLALPCKQGGLLEDYIKKADTLVKSNKFAGQKMYRHSRTKNG